MSSTVIFMAGCGTASLEATEPAINLLNLDTTTTPSHDFYQYATGGWQERTPLKDEFARYGSFDILRENNEVRIKELFTALAKQNNEMGSVGQKIVDLYNMGLDSISLNAQGATPTTEDLRFVTEQKDITTLIATLHRDVANPFFACYVDTDLKESTRNIMYIAQSGLSMGTRDYYLEERYEDLRTKYVEYIKTLLSLVDHPNPERIAKSVMEVEMAIAKASSSNVELRDPHANYNMMPVAKFKAQYDAIDWDRYATLVGFSLPEQINVGQLRQMECVNRLLKTLAPCTIQDYLSFNLLNSAAPYLADQYSDVSFEFFGKAMSGKLEQQPRWKRALAVPNGSLSEAVGQMYVAEYFPPEYKAQMLKLVENLQKALSIHIDNLEWMGEQTKAKAQEKLKTIYIKIGYPDKWRDYSTLTIDPTLPYWENIKRVNRWHTSENFAKLNKPVDRDEWWMSPQTVNAYYNPPTNEICFPAAILQPPFFNPTADDAVNYGAIGVVIGHEMTHGYDDQGRLFDKEGNLHDWWAKEDAEAFNTKAKLLAEQFNKIEVLPGLFANGEFTLGENIADQGGLRVAYTALKQSQGDNTSEPIDGFTPEQRFYLGYATLWAQNIRDEEIERLTNTDPHSLGKWRVNQTLKNIDTFYEAFDISDGDMYVAPADRVVIW